MTAQRLNRAHAPFISPIFDRQVRAFGPDVQRRLSGLRVGVIGVGGLGSALVAHLARLGVAHWVLVDPDIVELTNLNRLVGASAADAQKARPKVYVARSTIRQAVPKATVRALKTDVFDPLALRALKACDLLIVATDNHSSRMAANRLAVQYLIPLVHAGFNVSVGEAAKDRPDLRPVTDVSGEFAIPDLGRWCLQCAGIVDPQAAGLGVGASRPAAPSCASAATLLTPRLRPSATWTAWWRRWPRPRSTTWWRPSSRSTAT